MGSAFRAALIAGLKTDAVELVPSVPEDVRLLLPGRRRGAGRPERPRDHRRRPEPPRADRQRYDIIVTDPPPPIESSGASVISSLEYYQAGDDHLTPGGIMMQWVPYGQTIDEFMTHVRTFTAVFPQVTSSSGPAATACFMLGSESRSPSTRRDPERPGSARASSRTSRAPTTARAHGRRYGRPRSTRCTWLSGDAVTAFAGAGPMITDDRPVPEYFLIRRWIGSSSPVAVPQTLRAAAEAGGGG